MKSLHKQTSIYFTTIALPNQFFQSQLKPFVAESDEIIINYSLQQTGNHFFKAVKLELL